MIGAHGSVRLVAEAALVVGTGLRLGGYECCRRAARWGAAAIERWWAVPMR